MIELFGMESPNVLKIAIMLEEMGLPYEGRYVRVMHGQNYDPDFLAMNPLAKVPFIIDHDRGVKDQVIFESGAILIYLAETYESPLLPAHAPDRWEVLKWLMVQVSYAGPMLGQVNHFQLLPTEENSYAFNRYRRQAARVYRIVDSRLGAVRWLGGESYSIADIAMYPWSAYLSRHGFESSEHPNLIAWRDRMDERSPVKRAVVAMRNLVAGDPSQREAFKAEHLDLFFGRADASPPLDITRYANLGPMTSAKV